MFDGDNVCYGLCGDLGFSDKDCVENICCISEVVKFFVDVGIIVFIVFILFFKVDCDYCCSLMEDGEFVEVFIDIFFEVCEKCDLKGLYKKVCSGEIKDFIGIDLVYEVFEVLEVYLIY